jgi:hypothetical protein
MQKLEKPVELEGRVIRYKPIAKRIEKQNNQVGGFLKVGDKVRTKGKLLDKNLEGKENIFYVVETFPENSTHSNSIIIRHINNRHKLYAIFKDKVEKINNNSEASSASAASAAKVNNTSTWEELSGHVNNTKNDGDSEWSIVKNNDGKANMEKPVLVNSNSNNWVNVGKP